ncbi:MAG: phosphohydrolase, partial [Polaribacter sp.]
MSDFINKVYRNNTIIYKVLLFLFTTIAIVYLFPKGGQFKYDFNNGQLWKYDNLYATFDFAIQKTADEISLEKQQIKSNAKLYYQYDKKVLNEVTTAFRDKISNQKLNDSLNITALIELTTLGENIITKIYDFGFLETVEDDFLAEEDEIIALKKENEVEDVLFKTILTTKEVLNLINTSLEETTFLLLHKKLLLNTLASVIKPNVSYDKLFTEKIIDKEINRISYTKGKVSEGELIILRGDIVEGKKLAILNSLKSESESKIWTDSNYNWIVLGYTILVALALLMLLLFLNKYRFEIYENNNKVTFIFFNVFAIIFIQTLVIKFNSDYLYIVPLSILPIIIKAFFDARLGLFTHVLTVLLLGYIVPNSFEFIYLHIIAGIVTILTVSELYKRANLFISVAQITGIYMLTYFAFSVIKEGNISQINWDYFFLFAMNGLLS